MRIGPSIPAKAGPSSGGGDSPAARPAPPVAAPDQLAHSLTALRGELAQVSEATRQRRVLSQLEALGYAMHLAQSQGRCLDGLAAEAARLMRVQAGCGGDQNGTSAVEPDGADLNI